MEMSASSRSTGQRDREQGKRRRVLVVDDDPNIARVLTTALESDGHVVRCATQSLRVFDAALEFMPDLILMDVVMPYLDGFDQIRLLGIEESLSDIPIILVTARHNALASIEDPLKRRIVDCIYKPFDVDVLLSKVAAAAGSRPDPA
jgi:DNA-binding response OmpR family regulator